MRQSIFKRELFLRNVWSDNSDQKRNNGIIYWVCKAHSKDTEVMCYIRQMQEETIEQAFCRLYYKLKHHGGPIFTQMLSNLQKIRYSRMLWSEDVISLNKKISDILSQVQFLTQLQQAGGVDPDTFISSNNKLSEQLRRLKQEKAKASRYRQRRSGGSHPRSHGRAGGRAGFPRPALMRSCSMRL